MSLISLGIVSVNYFKKERYFWRILVFFWILFNLFHLLNHAPIGLNLFQYKKITFLFSLVTSFFICKKIKNAYQISIKLSQLSLILIFAAFISVKDVFIITKKPKYFLPAITPENSVIHLVLDMFSIEHTFKNKELEDANASLISKWGLTFYKNHYANYSETNFSIPQTLGQTLSEDNNFQLSPNYENVFHQFHKNKNKIYLWGESLPYCRMFSDITTNCYTRPQNENIFRELTNSLVLILGQFSDKIVPLFWGHEPKNLIVDNPVSSQNMFFDFTNFLNNFDLNSGQYYIYLHLLIPHSPFYLNKNCEVNKIFVTDEILTFDNEQESRYINQSLCALKFVDEMLTIIQKKSPKKWPKIVIHSDHGKTKSLSHEYLNQGLNSAEVIEASKIPAWTRAGNNPKSEIVNDLTSNESIYKFATGSLQTLEREKNVVFKYFQYWDKQFRIYSTTDGINWNSPH